MTFWEAVVLIAMVIIAIVVIRFNATLDLNKLLDHRQRWKVTKRQAKCPHTVAVKETGNGGITRYKTLAVNVAFRIEGETQEVTVCTRCGFQFLGGLPQAEQTRLSFSRNPKALAKQEKQFRKAERDFLRWW